MHAKFFNKLLVPAGIAHAFFYRAAMGKKAEPPKVKRGASVRMGSEPLPSFNGAIQQGASATGNKSPPSSPVSWLESKKLSKTRPHILV